MVALSPTGPWPKTATVSDSSNASRLTAWNAVPVPHEQAAASGKPSSSGILTHA